MLFTQERRRRGSQINGPSLVLPFALDKTLDPRITFTRASSGTYFDASGVLQTATTDEPRFDHNPANGESLGLLVEGAATNLLTYSEDFSNAAWSKTQCSISSNQITAPDGTLTVDKLVEDGTTNARDVRQTLSAGSGTYTKSVFAKYAGRVLRIVVLCNSSTSSVYCDFDLQAGTVSTPIVSNGSITSPSAKIESVGNGIYRCSLTATYGSTLTLALQRPVPSVGYAAGASYTGDGTSGIYIWGAQLETGSRASSYIKTEASTVTRAADSASMTGTNFSSWYNQAEGTFVLGHGVGETSGQSLVVAQNASVTNYIEIGWRPDGVTAPMANVIDGGVSQAALSGLSDGANYYAISYKANDFALSVNGGTASTDTSGTVPSVDRLVFYTPCTIKRLTYYPRRLTNGNLQELTA